MIGTRCLVVCASPYLVALDTLSGIAELASGLFVKESTAVFERVAFASVVITMQAAS